MLESGSWLDKLGVQFPRQGVVRSIRSLGTSFECAVAVGGSRDSILCVSLF